MNNKKRKRKKQGQAITPKEMERLERQKQHEIEEIRQVAGSGSMNIGIGDDQYGTAVAPSDNRPQIPSGERERDNFFEKEGDSFIVHQPLMVQQTVDRYISGKTDQFKQLKQAGITQKELEDITLSTLNDADYTAGDIINDNALGQFVNGLEDQLNKQFDKRDQAENIDEEFTQNVAVALGKATVVSLDLNWRHINEDRV